MLNLRDCDPVEMPRTTEGGHPADAPPAPDFLFGPLRLPASAVLLGFVLHALPAQAIEFGQGEVQGSLDTTISHGITWRVEGREERVHDFRSANSNDGNLNHGRGIVSNTSKFTSDLDIGYRNFGAFARVTGFYDFENEDGMGDRTALHPEARDLLGKELDLLDAYVTGAFYVGDAALDLRVGRHVLNWGESTFVTNGINAFNRFDVSKLRLPGSELREALAPIPMVSLSVAPTYNLSMEGFYQLDWEETVIDPVGSYFSTTDYVGPGAEEAVIADSRLEALLGPFGSNVDLGFSFERLLPGLTSAINDDLRDYQVSHPQFGMVPYPQPPQQEFDSEFLSVKRGADHTPEDSGQWGLALRYLAEDLNETEFGLYFANYHSRLPLLGARTSPRARVEAGLHAAGAVVGGTSTVAALVRQTTPVVTSQVMEAVQAGLVHPADAPAKIQEQVQQAVRQSVAGIAPALALNRYVAPDESGNRGHFFHEYPKNVRLLGLSFNTALGTSGWALQGDYALHLDAPLQRAERALIAEGLGPMFHTLGLANQAAEYEGRARAAAAAAASATDPVAAAAAAAEAQRYATLAQETGANLEGFLAGYGPSPIRGYIRHDVSQIQATATKVFPPVLGADALAFVTEAAVMHVHSMTDEPLEGPARASQLGDDEDADADATSWGYRMAARLDYNNALGAVNLFPYVQWRHDVNGNSPAPSGSFSEGLTALTLGVRADYLSSWQANVGYTRYGGRRNTLRDRDFVSASINYSF